MSSNEERYTIVLRRYGYVVRDRRCGVGVATPTRSLSQAEAIRDQLLALGPTQGQQKTCEEHTMIHLNDYTTFDHERLLGNAMFTSGVPIWQEAEYKRDVRYRFGDERTQDLRDGAKDMKIRGYSKMNREQLLDAIAQWRWDHLPGGYKADHPDAGRRY